MSEGKVKTIWNWRIFWPKIIDIESARSAAMYGVGASAFVSVVTAGVATISLLEQKPILGANAWSYIDALLMAIVAWRIKHYSRAFAIGGVGLFIIEKIVQFTMPPPGLDHGGGSALFWLIMLINGARGVFAYNRYIPTSVWGESSRAREFNERRGTASAVELLSAEVPIQPEIETREKERRPTFDEGIASAETRELNAKAPLVIIGVIIFAMAVALLSRERPMKTEQSQKPSIADGIAPLISDVAQAPTVAPQTLPVPAVVAGGQPSISDGIYPVIPLEQLGPSKTAPISIPNEFRAATQGDAKAQFYVGLAYDGGLDGVAKDPIEAVKWYRLAANQGNADAQGMLGSMYYDGEGVMRDPVEAAKWLRLSANQGNSHAQYILGLMYADGSNVEKDYHEAAKWLRLAANQGNDLAQYNMGVMYAGGRGVAQDSVEAVKLYRLSAAQGNAYAQYNLGLMYAKGEGVTRDYIEAHKWTTIATASGIRDLADMHKVLEMEMTKEQIAEAQRRATEWMNAHK